MRIKALIVLTALAATAMPAFAQGRSCQEVRANNQVGGALVGSILGGVFGSNIAASGHRGDGTAVGAVVGGLIGAGVGGSATDCRPAYPTYSPGYGAGSDYYPNPNYGGPYYDGRNGYPPHANDGYDYGYAGSYPQGDGYSTYRRDDDARRRDRYRGSTPQSGYYPDLDGGSYGSYKRDLDFAGLGCKDATQVTRLPDGSEVHRPVHVCQDPDTGAWEIRD